MSDSVERWIAALLGSPTSCPHGNPIPGLDELATQPDPSSDGPLVTLEQAAAGGSEKAVVRRISEQIQPDAEIMRDLRSAGVQPGRTVRLAPEGNGLSVTTDDGTTPSASAAAAESSAPAESPTDTAEATATESAPASEAPAPVMQPSELTVDATADQVSGALVVAGSDQGVADATISLVFRPSGDGDVKTVSVTTGADGKFSTDGAGSGKWTASFLGTDTAGPAAATAAVD